MLQIREFLAKIGLVVEEADESLGWLQLLVQNTICSSDAAGPLLKEANELVAIFVASEKTGRRNHEAEMASHKSARRGSRSRNR